MSLLAALLLLSDTSVELDPAWQPVADPTAVMATGQIQCIKPDPVRRTCYQMTWHSTAPDGTIHFRSVIALSNQHDLAMQVGGKLRRDGDAVCMEFDQKTVESIHLVGLSAPHTRVTSKRFLLHLNTPFIQALFDRTICDRIYRHSENGDFLNVSTVDGEFAAELMASFSLIEVKSGYRLYSDRD